MILPSELFQGIYFCTQQDPIWFETAYPAAAHPCVLALKALAAELRVVIPISFFEQDGPRYYNSVAVADADGEILGVYRKSHIPDGPGYQEKYYFRPGDTGFKAWKTKYGTIGVGICWDQWFPEAARAMVLAGAEVLFYPTAIGSEPSRRHARYAQTMAARHARPCGLERCARRGREPHRRRGERTARRSASTAIPSSPIMGASSCRASARRDEGVIVQSFDLAKSNATAPSGASSATAARTFTRRSIS